jgi:DNA-binding NarL/FixJ family response regulator
MRVAIGDDSALFGEGLSLLLTTAGVTETAHVRTGADLLRQVDQDPPDIAIVDIRMPPTHTDEGLATAERLRATHPDVGILVLSAYADTHYAARLASIDDRRVGYLLKDRVTNVTALREALTRIDDGENIIDPMIVNRLLARHHHAHLLASLTERERDVLRLMAEGRSNAGIGAELYIAPKTIEKHIGRIFLKLRLDPMEASTNPRVHAVLTWLRGHDNK